jgi:hypothetical protein
MTSSLGVSRLRPVTEAVIAVRRQHHSPDPSRPAGRLGFRAWNMAEHAGAWARIEGRARLQLDRHAGDEHMGKPSRGFGFRLIPAPGRLGDNEARKRCQSSVELAAALCYK